MSAPPVPGPGSGWVARALVAPLVLVVVLTSHVIERRSSDLTPWKGGGFGMFSTVDSPAGRVVRVDLDTDVGSLRVAIPRSLKSEASAVRAAPSSDRLLGLARGLAGQWWVVPDIASITGLDGLPSDGAGDNDNDGGDGGGGGDNAGLDEAAEALTRAVAVDVVQAVAPSAFDAGSQRRLTVHRVTVAVLRPDVEAGSGSDHGLVLTPTLIREATIVLAPPVADGEVGS